MLITLVFIEHNCTFNLVRTLALKVMSVGSGHLPTGIPWITLALHVVW